MTKRNGASPIIKLAKPLLKFIETPFSVEIRSNAAGEHTLVLGGVHKILIYETEEMSFSCQGCQLSVKGKRLFCNTYQNGYVEITGKIEELSLR